MTEDKQDRKPKRMRLWLVLAFVAVLLAVLIVPPMLSISRYKSRITQLMSASLGRPVRLSSVELRLLPRPGFVLTDLTVDDDPSFGAEPVLHANTVTASIRLLSLWRGRLEIGRVSVDEASLNLMRTGEGGWNLDTLFRTATAQNHAVGTSTPAVTLPYLEATNSRINIKNGTEKLPFSLLNAKVSFWQQDPGDWRIEVRGQPSRTDLSLEQGDTGEIRLEARLRHAAQISQMPLHVDLEWREAQLGQLTRLILGADSGWRGDMTGELHLDGTTESAQVTSRLRATGVHRAEFAPVSPLDFDAKCGFVYHYVSQSMENLSCDSPLGDGHIRLAGDLPAQGGQQHLSVELDRIPVSASLDVLRTVRNDFAPDIEAKGTISGKVLYSEAAPVPDAPEKPSARINHAKGHLAKAHPATQGPLTGSFTVDGFQLSGKNLSEPIQVAKLVLEPAPAQSPVPGTPQSALPDAPPAPALMATMTFPAGGTAPLTITSRLALSGYQVTVHGQASFVRARDLARVANLKEAAALEALAGDPIAVDLNASGPWLPMDKTSLAITPPAAAVANSLTAPVVTATEPLPATDHLSGTVTLHNANWKADYLVNHVQISQATLHLEDGQSRWDPVTFSYGPVKGTAMLSFSANCEAPQPCVPKFQLQFGALDASVLQEALLGAHEPGTMLSTLIERLRPASSPAWPKLEGTVSIESLILGPVTLRGATAVVRVQENGAEISSLEAGLLGGRVNGAGSLHTAATSKDKPSYTFEGRFEKLNSQAVGLLLNQHWSGGLFEANGKVDLSGYTEKDLAASAKGSLHFDWQHGAVSAAPGSLSSTLARFDRWSSDTQIANGAITLQQNQVQRAGHSSAIEATASLGAGAKVSFTAPKEARNTSGR